MASFFLSDYYEMSVAKSGITETKKYIDHSFFKKQSLRARILQPAGL